MNIAKRAFFSFLFFFFSFLFFAGGGVWTGGNNNTRYRLFECSRTSEGSLRNTYVYTGTVPYVPCLLILIDLILSLLIR